MIFLDWEAGRYSVSSGSSHSASSHRLNIFSGQMSTVNCVEASNSADPYTHWTQ